MPKETFGGDDDEEAPEEKKKLGLEKFELSPDVNIRDLFWRIMGSYAATKKPGIELASLEHDRFALMRSAVSVLSNPDSMQYGLSPRFVSIYSMMMMLDAGWKDIFMQFLELSLDKKLKIADHVKGALKKMVLQERYKERLYSYLGEMLRKSGTSPVALRHIADIDEQELSQSLKKELIIFARGDIGENQQNAIRAISVIKDDSDVRKSFIILLSHWDKEARMAAANALKDSKDEDVKKAAAKRLETETDEQVKKVLRRIAK